MKKIILFLLLTAFFFPKINFACSCLVPESFCEGIKDSEGNILEDIMIVRGQFIGNTSKGLGIDIQESIYGTSIDQGQFNLHTTFCTLFSEQLEQGEDYIFAFIKGEDLFHPLACRIFFLKIENEVVKGKIAPGVEAIDYDKLGELKKCAYAFHFNNLEKSVLLYPNPTSGAIQIRNISTTKTLADVEIKIFDITGKQHQGYKSAEGILPEEVWNINLQNLAAGIYIIQVSERHLKKSFRIVKQ